MERSLQDDQQIYKQTREKERGREGGDEYERGEKCGERTRVAGGRTSENAQL